MVIDPTLTEGGVVDAPPGSQPAEQAPPTAESANQDAAATPVEPKTPAEIHGMYQVWPRNQKPDGWESL